MSEVQHSIKLAAKRSGLSPHVIRVWEKRYDAVSPNRTDTNRRKYTEAEIERLTLLRMATLSGHTIGNIARLPTEKLRQLIIPETIAKPDPGLAAPVPAGAKPEDFIVTAISAVERSNAPAFEKILREAALAFGPHGVLERVIAPMVRKLGDLWRDGTITAAHEHFASAAIRDFLIRNSRPYALNGSAPTIIVATPAGQLHELGAVLVAAAANDMGWRVIYLGISLSAMEIAGAAIQHKVRAVALSIVFPGDDPGLPSELERLRSLVPSDVRILAGGRAAESYALPLEQNGITRLKNLNELYETLDAMRTPR